MAYTAIQRMQRINQQRFGNEGFYQKLGFEVIPNGIRKMIEIKC